MKNVLKSLNHHPIAHLFNKPDLNFKETRIFLGLSKVYLRILIKNRSVPFHNRYHQCRIFKKTELLDWVQRIGSSPEKELEKETASRLRRIHDRKSVLSKQSLS